MVTISPQERKALEEALDDEYKSHATYEQVIRDFGPARPFINIVEAEARHVSALLSLFEQYSIPVPKNHWPSHTVRFASVHEACAAAVQAEIENAALYDRLLASVQRPELRVVLQSLQSASRDRHLPAFLRCVQRRA